MDWGVSKSIVNDSIQWVEEVLAKSKKFALPSKRKSVNEDAPFVVLMDVTEGYQGLAKLHINTVLPSKARKKHKLTLCENLYNRACRQLSRIYRKHKQLHQKVSYILQKKIFTQICFDLCGI